MKFICTLVLLSSALFGEIDYYRFLEQFSETLGRDGSWKNGEIEGPLSARSGRSIALLRASVSGHHLFCSGENMAWDVLFRRFEKLKRRKSIVKPMFSPL